MDYKTERTIFFVSDGTGITVETLGQSLLTQFPSIKFHQHIYPFTKSKELAQQAIADLKNHISNGSKPLVFVSVTDPEIRAEFSGHSFDIIDIFSSFIPQLEASLQTRSIPTRGEAHGIGAPSDYQRRISALNFTLEHDDGLRTASFHEAEIILIGVSRSGKTPTCLYLAMHYLLKAANYPLTEDDFHFQGLPPVIQPFKQKLFGLTISPQQLCRIREERRPTSRYASLEQCATEVRWTESLYAAERIPFINTSSISIEEIATTAVQALGLKAEGKW